MYDILVGGHDADMAEKEDEVAARERRRIDIRGGAERGKLQVAVARKLDARRAPHELDEARAVDSLGGAPAPKIGGADHLFGQFGGILVLRRHLGERGEGQIAVRGREPFALRSEEHTSELQSLMRISYAVFCLTKKQPPTNLED